MPLIKQQFEPKCPNLSDLKLEIKLFCSWKEAEKWLQNDPCIFSELYNFTDIMITYNLPWASALIETLFI